MRWFPCTPYLPTLRLPWLSRAISLVANAGRSAVSQHTLDAGVIPAALFLIVGRSGDTQLASSGLALYPG